MNIVRLVEHFPSYDDLKFGLQPTIYHLSKEQAKLGVNINVICKSAPSKPGYEELAGVRVHRVAFPYNLTMLLKLRELHKLTPVDLIHIHATSGLSYAVATKISPLLRSRIPYIAHVHGTTLGIVSAYQKFAPEVLSEETPSQLLRRMKAAVRETIVWRSADAVITNSQFLQSELAAFYGIPKERTHVVYNGVDIDNFRHSDSKKKISKTLGLDPESSWVLYLGGFRPVKGPMCLLKAFEKACQKVKNAVLLFVGGHHPLDKITNKNMAQKLRRLQRQQVVRLLENIPHADLPEYYSASDVLVVPSIYDALPKVVLEAMACETPFIASSTGGISEVIGDTTMASLVTPGDVDELASALVMRLSTQSMHEDHLQTHSCENRSLIKESFTWKRSAVQCLTIYRKIAGLPE